MRLFSERYAWVALFFAATLIVTPSSAQERWSGFSVGVGGGASTADLDANLNFIRRPNNPRRNKFSVNDDEWNGFGTLYAGYDFVAAPGFLIGAFADFDFAGDNGIAFSRVVDLSPGGGANPRDANVTGSAQIDNVWSVGLRLGYLIDPQWLVYANGGYTEADLSGSLTLKNTRNGVTDTQNFFSDDVSGYFLGGGSEYMFYQSNNAGGLALRFEYRYAEFDSETASARYQLGGGNRNLFLVDGTLDADPVQSVRGVLVWKLGNP